MKVHTTNYRNTFIETAVDCPVKTGVIPLTRGENKSIANLQHELLIKNPYKYTSDEILFSVFSQRNEVPKNELEEQKQKFFSKGQPCFRASPLTKHYGWGIHSNDEGRIALYGVETNQYKKFLTDPSVKKVKAMRSKRA